MKLDRTISFQVTDALKSAVVQPLVVDSNTIETLRFQRHAHAFTSASRQRRVATALNTSTVLYNGSGLPQSQPWLRFGQLPVPSSTDMLPFFSSKVKPASQTTGINGVTLNTQLFSSPFPTGTNANTGYAGYSNHRFDFTTGTLKRVNTAFPVLDRAKGFTLSFKLALQSESSSTSNRAGFSVIALSSDKYGIELGFKANQIFAQSSQFAAAEKWTPTLNLTNSIDYKLSIQGSQYKLFANQTQILSGSLRQYQFNPATSSPMLPANPYTTPNFLFFGDNTDQARATVTLGKISIA